MPKKPQTDIWGNVIQGPDAKLSPGCSFKRSKLGTDEEGRLNRIFYNEEGKIIHVILGSKLHTRTDISVSYSVDPCEYAKVYYRNVRRYREGNKPRLPDI